MKGGDKMQLIDKSTLVEYIQDLIEKNTKQEYNSFVNGNRLLMSEASERKRLLQTLLGVVNEMKVKDAINDNDVAYFSEEHVRVTVFAYLQGLSEFVQSTYGVNISAGTITDNIMRNMKGGCNA